MIRAPACCLDRTRHRCSTCRGFLSITNSTHLVNAGLTPFQALRTGTVYPAEFFGAADRFGSVAEGLEADLILVSSNPLLSVTTLREPLGVMVRGQWLDRAEIDRRLGQLAEKYSSVGLEPAPSATDAANTMHSHSPVPCR